MKRELLSRAFGDMDARFVAEAYRGPGDAPGSSERNVRMKTKRLITAVLAAVLLLALASAAYASSTGGCRSILRSGRERTFPPGSRNTWIRKAWRSARAKRWTAIRSRWSRSSAAGWSSA